MKIIQYPNPILEVPTELVTEFNKELNDTLIEMIEVMDKAKGIGLAAPQVGINKSFFVMRDNQNKPIFIVNPKIIESDGHSIMQEGCLSLPGIYLQIPSRADTIIAEFQDGSGEWFKGVFTGLEAVCFQHEYDHIQGIFFINKVSRNQRRAALRTAQKEK